MKKILTAVLGALGVTSINVEAEPPKVVSVPVESIRFSMPTISLDSVEFDMPTPSSFKGAPQFHEDEWAQLEFFPRTRISEVQQLLKKLKSFEAENRIQYGWKQIYKRELSRTPLGV